VVSASLLLRGIGTEMRCLAARRVVFDLLINNVEIALPTAIVVN